jgi:hypothetical protein
LNSRLNQSLLRAPDFAKHGLVQQLPNQRKKLFAHTFQEAGVTPLSGTEREAYDMVTLPEETNRSESHFQETTDANFRALEYKHCRIHATSYQVGLEEWVPEAYFWKSTETGWRRFWVQNVEPLFRNQGLTFLHQRDADFQAFSLARTLIDTIGGELPKPTRKPKLSLASYVAQLLRSS